MDRATPAQGEASAHVYGPPQDADIDAAQLAALAETEALDRVLELLRRELDLR
ncbi:hypothetical protein [Hydrocarboniphaga sp.]|uniref:hypothetical protein n=1 Tax=Hydrocarboniphaga sp. TaxID=2033016 RepID=UPI003D11CABE